MKHNELSQTDVPPTDLHDFYTIVHNGKNKLCDECGERKLQTYHHFRIDEPGVCKSTCDRRYTL